MEMKRKNLIGMAAMIAAAALLLPGCATRDNASAHSQGLATPSPKPGSARARARAIGDVYTPIVIKAAPTTSASARAAKRSTAKIGTRSVAIPSGMDQTFDLTCTDFHGLSSFTAKARLFTADISEDSGVDNITWDQTSPLSGVFPGISGSSKSVSINSSNTPHGSVTINVPAAYEGKNLILLITKKSTIDGTPYQFGGGEFVTILPQP